MLTSGWFKYLEIVLWSFRKWCIYGVSGWDRYLVLLLKTKRVKNTEKT